MDKARTLPEFSNSQHVVLLVRFMLQYPTTSRISEGSSALGHLYPARRKEYCRECRSKTGLIEPDLLCPGSRVRLAEGLFQMFCSNLSPHRTLCTVLVAHCQCGIVDGVTQHPVLALLSLARAAQKQAYKTISAAQHQG